MRRLIWAALAVGLVAALVKLGEDREALAARQAAERTRIENLYHRIDDDLNDVDVSLSKLSAASSPRQSVLLLGDVWRATGSAGAAMGLLPLSHADSCDMSQFVTRCGDYAHALMGRVLQGRALTEEDRRQLGDMRAACAQIRQVAGEAIQSGDYVAADNVDAGCYEQSQSEAAISEYPTLIYDGPFSESAENRPPQGEIGERITAQQAAERARRLFSDGTVAETVYVPGALPVYELSVQSASRGQVSLSLTEQGGELLSFMGAPTGDKNDPPSDEESEKLKAAALSFLQELGVEDPAAAYAQYYQGAAVLNFAPRQAGVILYSDLVKVYMDRETGEVMGLDARNYRLNHRQRALPRPKLTEEEAGAYVSGELQVEHTDLALIPLTQQTEVLCYEFKATKDGTFYIVYVNALTGEEEQIFQVINSAEGDLVV
ncbi:MAG: germination protein YpeB [Clostridia bacterium]|nr:germination protein YpeB [Clostridia bacterium]MBQ3651455.1 germination protein YpeB [Clostridia bacterium]MBQ6866687.1 germination protein YpeB [Clostridia bacterium]MBQ9322873.1 germination protein YpeB [Clostridia bacterium]MBR0421384.1 germination protein YpeB [Clostridia bacterium]